MASGGCKGEVSGGLGVDLIGWGLAGSGNEAVVGEGAGEGVTKLQD